MADRSMKNKGLLIQLIGFCILLAGTRGFYIFHNPFLYIAGLIAGVVMFAVYLFWVGLLCRKGKG